MLLFAHVLAAAIWFGAGMLLLLLGARFERVGDDAGLKALFEQSAWTAQRIFIPASLSVLVLGILLVFEGPWSFDDLWIVLGLVGFATTFATGVLVLKPSSEAVARLLVGSGMSDEARRGIRRVFVLQRIDYVVIAMVFAAMALKPTKDDVGTLAIMAAIVLVVVVLSLRAAGRDAPAHGAAGDAA
ncbi:MAG: DUF2269 family protein [Pseudomonadota bacterium]